VTKRVIDLRFGEQPLLDIAGYARGSVVLTPARRLHIALTVHRSPEVMSRCLEARHGGGRRMHMAYVGREGDLGLEMDCGTRVDGKDFEQPSSAIGIWTLRRWIRDQRRPIRAASRSSSSTT